MTVTFGRVDKNDDDNDDDGDDDDEEEEEEGEEDACDDHGQQQMTAVLQRGIKAEQKLKRLKRASLSTDKSTSWVTALISKKG